MAKISVVEMNPTTFEVTVEARSTTVHRVTVDGDYAVQLTGGKVSAATLVQRSFDFLLQREPNTSILRSFDLPVIGRYFPEYEKTISALL